MPDGDERDQRVRAQIRSVFRGEEVPPTDTYLGLTLEEAHALAEKEGRRLVDRTTTFRTRRADLVTNRVNIRLGADSHVAEADLG